VGVTPEAGAAVLVITSTCGCGKVGATEGTWPLQAARLKANAKTRPVFFIAAS
jgi:hypothetical protein